MREVFQMRIYLEKKTARTWGVAAPHVHTTASDGMFTPSYVVEKAQKLGIDVIAITDHDNKDGIEEAKKVGEELGMEVIGGQEVTTKIAFPPGHIVIYEAPPIRSFQGLEATLAEARINNGTILLPHPGIGSFRKRKVQELIREGEVDAVEIISGRFKYPKGLKDSITNPITKGVAPIGSSDSHFGEHDIFNGVTFFPGKTKEDFLKAIKENTTIPWVGEKSFPGIHKFLGQQWKSLFAFGLRKYRDYFLQKIGFGE